MELPLIGLGTYELTGDLGAQVVKEALALGYRHIDTAHIYQNHTAIHKAIQGFPRDKLYITSKIAVDEQVEADVARSVQKACNSALKELGTDYLDLYLIHWPKPGFPLEEIFLAMQQLAIQGKIRRAGVSNYNIRFLEELKKAGGTPFANQVEFHPYLNQRELLRYCEEHEITLIAFRPFGKGKLLREEPLFSRIGKRYGKTGAQVILRWLIQQKIPVVPKASSKKHLEENLKIFDFALTEEEMLTLSSFDKNQRYCCAGDPIYQ